MMISYAMMLTQGCINLDVILPWCWIHLTTMLYQHNINLATRLPRGCTDIQPWCHNITSTLLQCWHEAASALLQFCNSCINLATMLLKAYINFTIMSSRWSINLPSTLSWWDQLHVVTRLFQPCHLFVMLLDRPTQPCYHLSRGCIIDISP